MKKLALIASAMIAVSVPIGSDAQTTSGSPPQLPASSASNSPITSLKAERDAMRQRYRQSRADFIATRDTWRAKSAELKSAKQANNTAISTSLKTELVTLRPRYLQAVSDFRTIGKQWRDIAQRIKATPQNP